MGAGVPQAKIKRRLQAKIKRRLRYLANKYVGVEFVVLYASNGEVAILPVNPETGMVDLYKWHLAHLAEFVKDRSGKTKRQADRVSVVEL